MFRRLFLVAVLVGVPSLAAAQTCTTPKPGAEWVCVNGGWLPPGHPGIPQTPATPAPQPPPTNQPTPDLPFFLGHRYTRGTTDVRIIGTGQFEGTSVLFAICNAEGDGCFFKGYIRMFLSNATSKDWTDLGPY